MSAFFAIIAVFFLCALFIELNKNKKLAKSIDESRQESERLRQQFEAESQRIYNETQTAVAKAQESLDQQVAEMKVEFERVRQHYENEARKSQDEANTLISKTLKDVEPLRKYEGLKDAEAEAQRHLTDAIKEATSLREEAKALLEQSRTFTADERTRIVQKATEIQEQTTALLNQARHDAGRILEDAKKRAEQTAGDAYSALNDKQMLEQAVKAMRNIIDGYGERYIVPTRSLLDELAIEFGYTAAGEMLKSSREQSRKMVEQEEAAACDYVESNRRATAIQFVLVAFNGRVDAILSRSRHDNYGTLEQEIRDAFSIVNLNGAAFRNARILPTYLDARLSELKWAVVVHELALKQREEQRYIKERIRDEEKARKEYEQKMREAAREEELKRTALEEAEKKFAQANAAEKANMQQELEKLRQELVDANTRKLTIAQQTKKGHVYIISNIGSFGDGIYKIGQTRRPDPQERVDELGDASVPFEFDVHALIESANAPALEHKLHKTFLAMQVNKMNSRREFFRINLADIHLEVEKLKQGEDFTIKLWTDKATATEYKESVAIENDPEAKVKWLARQKALSDRQLKLDALRLPVVADTEPSTEEQED